jgi:hypothetical protein
VPLLRLASIQKKSRSPSHFVAIQTSTVRTPRRRLRSNAFIRFTYWRSIQLALCRTKKAERDLDLSKPKFSKNRPRYIRGILCSALLFHSRRATQDNKIRLFVNSLSGAGRPSSRSTRGRIKRCLAAHCLCISIERILRRSSL